MADQAGGSRRRAREPDRVFAAPPPENLTCVVCTDVFSDPVVIACGHGFCRACIAAWLGDPAKRCPIGRCELSAAAAGPLRVAEMPTCVPLKSAVHALPVVCRWGLREEGDAWVVDAAGCPARPPLGDAAAHEAACEHAAREYTCPYAGCGARVRRRDADAHDRDAMARHLRGERDARIAAQAAAAGGAAGADRPATAAQAAAAGGAAGADRPVTAAQRRVLAACAVLAACGDDEKAVLFACDALQRAIGEDADNRRCAIAAGGVEATLEALAKHTRSEEVTFCTCSLLKEIMVFGRSADFRHVVTGHAVRTVVDALMSRACTSKAAPVACGVLARMFRAHPDARRHEAVADAVGAFVATIRAHVACPESVAAACLVLFAVCNVESPEAKKRAVRAGAVEAVTEALKTHVSGVQPNLVSVACRTIVTLVNSFSGRALPEHQLRANAAGVVPLARIAITAYPEDIAVLGDACVLLASAARGLAEKEFTLSTRDIVAALRVHSVAHARFAYVACIALECISEHDTGLAELRGIEGAAELLRAQTGDAKLVADVVLSRL